MITTKETRTPKATGPVSVVIGSTTVTSLGSVAFSGLEKEGLMDTATALGFRVRVRCNSCFKFSWITHENPYAIVNYLPCGRCQQSNAVMYKVIGIRAEKDHGPKCAGPCQSSKSGDCECRCGGKNHGSAA